MPYVLSRQGRRDVDLMAKEIATERGRQAADRMIDRVTTTFQMLGDHPLAGRDRSDDLGSGRRSFVSGQSIVIYRVIGHDVLVDRVIDGRRDYPAIFQS